MTDKQRCARELAAFLAHVLVETNGNAPDRINPKTGKKVPLIDQGLVHIIDQKCRGKSTPECALNNSLKMASWLKADFE